MRSKLPDGIDPKRMKDQEFESKVGIGYRQYCGKCGTHVTPENFSNMWCRKCNTGIRYHGIYCVAEDGSEGYEFRKEDLMEKKQ